MRSYVLRYGWFLCLILVLGAMLSPQAGAQVGLVQLSQDSFTDQPSQHKTEVEPSVFTFGSTIVTAFQVARIFSGGGADIGFATSTDGGTTWNSGYLPGITIYQGNGTYNAVSDASVAYDAKHGLWLISTLPISNTASNAVAVSSSSDGLHWNNPVFVTKTGDPDKNWIVCDNSAKSPFFGHCYQEWDSTDTGAILMSTSTDGGQTWSPPIGTAGRDGGIGGLPLVKPSGLVIVPFAGFNGIEAFTSTNGGASWTAAVTVASDFSHGEAGGIRSAGLPSAAMNKGGKVWVAWSDCRFRTNCAENDIVYSKSGSGNTWGTVKRVPIDPTNSTVDHFITGMAIQPGTGGTSTHVGIAYYFYPVSNCGNSCQLSVGFIQSTNNGVSWSAPVTLGGPMNVETWLPDTFSGFMVADYIGVGFGTGGKAFPVFSLANAPVGGLFQQAIYTTSTGLDVPELADEYLSAETDHPVPDAHSDHGPRQYMDQENLIPIGSRKPPSSRE